MTPEQTRQLGIEFERRVQTMIPEKEYLDKLDTDTIYAYLNSYLDKYIHDIYRNLDQVKSGSKLSAHVEAVLLEMLRTQTIPVEDAKNYTQDIQDENGITIVENGRSVTYPLDPSFYMYVRSVSSVSSTYSFKNPNGQNQSIRILPNELVSQSDVWRLLETPHNSLRILRYPAATIGEYLPYDAYKITRLNDAVIGPIGESDVYKNSENYIVIGSSLPEEYLSSQFSKRGIVNMLCKFASDIDEAELLNALGEYESGDYALIDFQFHRTLQDGPTEMHTLYKVQRDSKDIYLPTLNVIYDQYTTPVGIKVMYYAQPKRFDIMTSTACELPMDAFDDIVTGAVDLYVQYVAGAEANKRRIQEALRKQNKQLEDNEE